MGKLWIVAPTIVVVAWLALTAVPSFEWTNAVIAFSGFFYLPLLWVGLIAVRVRSERGDATYLALCAHAPLTLVPAWFRNDNALRGFLDALSEPSVELIAGGIGLFVCAFLPVFLAWRTYVSGTGRSTRATCVAIYFVAWIVVLVAFDAYMFFGGVLAFCGVLWFSVGALGRLIVFVALLMFAFHDTRTRR